MALDWLNSRLLLLIKTITLLIFALHRLQRLGLYIIVLLQYNLAILWWALTTTTVDAEWVSFEVLRK